MRCGEIRHVQRAGHAVDHRHADQEQERRHQVHDDVVQAGLHARGTGAVQHQTVGRREQHLEEHEQIEEIARQERAVQPHQQELKHRVKRRRRRDPSERANR